MPHFNFIENELSPSHECNNYILQCVKQRQRENEQLMCPKYNLLYLILIIVIDRWFLMHYK